MTEDPVKAAIDSAVKSEPEPEVEASDFGRYWRNVESEAITCVVRVMNPYQHDKAQGKAIAARQRRVVALKDPESEASALVELRLEAFEEHSDEQLIDWLTDKHLADALRGAMEALESSEDERDAPFRQIDDHRRRYYAGVENGETDTDEFRAVSKIIEDYSRALKERTELLMEPHRARYDGMDREALLHCVRRAICKSVADTEFIDVFKQWNMYYGTRKPDSLALYFPTFEDFMEAPREVHEVLTREFDLLERQGAVLDAKKSDAATPSSPSSDSSEASATGE